MSGLNNDDVEVMQQKHEIFAQLSQEDMDQFDEIEEQNLEDEHSFHAQPRKEAKKQGFAPEATAKLVIPKRQNFIDDEELANAE